jgi:hypothetical protein
MTPARRHSFSAVWIGDRQVCFFRPHFTTCWRLGDMVLYSQMCTFAASTIYLLGARSETFWRRSESTKQTSAPSKDYLSCLRLAQRRRHFVNFSVQSRMKIPEKSPFFLGYIYPQIQVCSCQGQSETRIGTCNLRLKSPISPDFKSRFPSAHASKQRKLSPEPESITEICFTATTMAESAAVNQSYFK